MARATPRTLLIVLLPYLGSLLYAWAEFNRYELSWDIDYYGAPLVRAARLGSHAFAQQLLEPEVGLVLCPHLGVCGAERLLPAHTLALFAELLRVVYGARAGVFHLLHHLKRVLVLEVEL